jgi:hypothetical protein
MMNNTTPRQIATDPSNKAPVWDDPYYGRGIDGRAPLTGTDMGISSYLVGACTGRSAGFSPFRM